MAASEINLHFFFFFACATYYHYTSKTFAIICFIFEIECYLEREAFDKECLSDLTSILFIQSNLLHQTPAVPKKSVRCNQVSTI